MIFNAYTEENTGTLGIRIKSCGHIFAKKGRTINRPKGREDWLLFYVAKGAEKFTLDREEVAEAGSFLFYRPGERQEHVCISDTTAEFYYVHFYLPSGASPTVLETSRLYRAKPSAAVRDLFEAILSEVELKLPRYGTVAVGKLLSVIGILERSVSENETHSRENIEEIAVVLRRMNREFASPHSLDDYAAMCRMSKFHFLRIFKSITGVPPLEYRNRLRIEHAKQLLLDTFLPVSEIGARVGYASPSYFCDAFKKTVGISPREYREKGDG